MKLVTVILDSSSQTSSGVRNLETTHFPLYSRLGAKCGAVERRPSRDFREARFWIVVAVGTTITDRPPHRSVHARLRIRLLPRMNGVEALVGIRMQNTWVRNPPVEQWVETVPSHLRALTATN